MNIENKMNTDKVKYIIQIINDALSRNNNTQQNNNIQQNNNTQQNNNNNTSSRNNTNTQQNNKNNTQQNNNIFDYVVGRINDCGNRLGGSSAINTINDYHHTDKKNKGDLWEAFCYLYLLNVLKHDTVWLYKDVPAEIRKHLCLPAKDYGIDIISVKNGAFYAIQCKFKKPSEKTQLISWDTLSTFYAIVTKTGPWEKHVVITNVNGCRHIGHKTEKDLSICLGTFAGLDRFNWIEMIGGIPADISAPTSSLPAPLNMEELRKKRLEMLDKSN